MMTDNPQFNEFSQPVIVCRRQREFLPTHTPVPVAGRNPERPTKSHPEEAGDGSGEPPRLATFIKRRLANASITDRCPIYQLLDSSPGDRDRCLFPFSSTSFSRGERRGGGREADPTKAVHQGGRTETFCQNKLTRNN